jgi:hypothetical protein
MKNVDVRFHKRAKAQSARARKLQRWSDSLYWAGAISAFSMLGISVAFALLDQESIFQRIDSVLILGVLPALLIRGGVFVTCLALRGAISLTDPYAADQYAADLK